MEPKLIAIAEKIHARPALYTFLERLYWSRGARKRAYRAIAAELVLEGTVRRITPAQVKKAYYKLRGQYRNIEKKINPNPALILPRLSNLEADVYRRLGFLKHYIRYKNGMENV